MPTPLAIQYVCRGCGTTAPVERPLRCPKAQAPGDVEHVLARHLNLERVSFPQSNEKNPFLRFKELLHPYQMARARGLKRGTYEELVTTLDRRIRALGGTGFHETPFGQRPELARQAGLKGGSLWVKDETGGVGGSHKGRHLMVPLLHYELERRLVPESASRDKAPLALASCGNAALAAALLARAAGRSLWVFLPAQAPARIRDQLLALEARVTPCPRQPGIRGDPSYQRFQAALEAGVRPFCCQGPDLALNIEGGSTLAYEMAATLKDQGQRLDRLFIQVGGGALASACMEGLEEAFALGALPGPLPRVHAVQSRQAAPLVRAFDGLLKRVQERLDPRGGWSPHPEELSVRIRQALTSELLEELIQEAAQQRGRFMQPWPKEPQSLAAGILDDETYDWLAVVRGMLKSGGYPVVVEEETLAEAWRIGRQATGIPVTPTGTAGLAGLLTLVRSGALARGENIGILFTGGEH